MKKFINNPQDLSAELLEGFALVYPHKVQVTDTGLVVRAEPKPAGRVQLVTHGGSGHEPALSGFVGAGMLDISVPGDIFAAPGPNRVVEALRLADQGGAGVLFVVLNHDGDRLSANVAMDTARAEGLNVRTVLTTDDIAGGPKSDPDNRRGLVGCIPLYKVAGAAAEQGKSLDEVVAIAERFRDNMATLAVAVNSASHPQSGDYMFELADDEMEIGMGQHGEAGTGRMPLKSADETAETMINMLLDDLEAKSGDRLLVLVNGTGATTLMEMYIIFRRVVQVCAAKGIEVVRGGCGEYLTVQEMAGFQLFAAKLDDELLALWDAPADTPNLTVV